MWDVFLGSVGILGDIYTAVSSITLSLKWISDQQSAFLNNSLNMSYQSLKSIRQ